MIIAYEIAESVESLCWIDSIEESSLKTVESIAIGFNRILFFVDQSFAVFRNLTSIIAAVKRCLMDDHQ